MNCVVRNLDNHVVLSVWTLRAVFPLKAVRLVLRKQTLAVAVGRE